jgi:hypothetical protein
MATLILQQADRRRGAVLNGRVVIGRRPTSDIPIRDRSVSRIHAWIGNTNDDYFVADSGSRTGTKVNGEHMRGRRALRDGDVIQIGPAKLIFGANGSLPSDVEPLDLGHNKLAADDGIFLDCDCGAPIWVPWECAGKTGRCRGCDRLVKLPLRPGADAPVDPMNDTMAPGMASNISRRNAGSVRVAPAAAPAGLSASELLDEGEARLRNDEPENRAASPETICGACQSAVSFLEEITRCPDCGVAFHSGCWVENHGCSSYGCKQVGILSPKPAPSAPTTELPAIPQIEITGEKTAPPGSGMEPHGVQWGYLLLPASFLLGLASVLTFGGPSLLLAIGVVLFGLRRKSQSGKLGAAVLIVSIVAAAAGSAFSTYWWLAAPAGRFYRP